MVPFPRRLPHTISPLEEAGFEPSVPLYILTVSDPLLVGPVTVPFAKRKSPVRDRVQAFDACFRRRVYRATAWGLSAGALPGWRDLHPSAYGHAAGEVVRARAITAMVLRSRLQNHVEGRLRRAPDALEAARPDYLANPCLVGLRRAPHRPPATARSARRPSSNPR